MCGTERGDFESDYSNAGAQVINGDGWLNNVDE